MSAERRGPPRDGMKRVTVSYLNHGQPAQLEVEVPAAAGSDADARQEAAAFVQMLADTRQLDGDSATHEIVTEADGTRWLRRSRLKGR